jgi:hypothetical protein
MIVSFSLLGFSAGELPPAHSSAGIRGSAKTTPPFPVLLVSINHSGVHTEAAISLMTNRGVAARGIESGTADPAAPGPPASLRSVMAPALTVTGTASPALGRQGSRAATSRAQAAGTGAGLAFAIKKNSQKRHHPVRNPACR